MNKHSDDVIDAIVMKRNIQEKIYEDTKNLTSEEFITYMRQRVANSPFAAMLRNGPLAGSIDDPTFVRGDQPLAEERVSLD